MEKKRETPFSAGDHHRAPWAGLTFVVGLAALFVVFYPEHMEPKVRHSQPPVTPQVAHQVTSLPDFGAIPIVAEKKEAFFSFMRPIVEAENNAILALRHRLIELHEAEDFGADEHAWISDLATTYKLSPFSPVATEDRESLLARVDMIPLSLALAQAANESAWGTSRFAREGNNLFGQWVFGEGKGMVPKNRTEGASHKVACFDSVADSVRGYLHNLNTLWAYEPLRDIRREQRSRGEEPDGESLAAGLVRYSSRGDAYIREIQQLIRMNASLLSKR
ncbi:glucosaminidase domain-containing protein [Desulfoluna spongiiphila]|uniref:Bax protein n=1 Tax=Desulfoluna spongiiphila TaxID=419481 RepID=A0A1G5J8W4_9BACT|nr:glucosaminidase domain-containing protein [Desulfoluna spongiiphila]SCY84806.1 Bax protein [Desulfoluna spongiiphila]VVS91006.1 mannosyl-glycoprotein endo-beta-n-acetylglucosamidase-like domain [Desulfoluna spongiiphila]